MRQIFRNKKTILLLFLCSILQQAHAQEYFSRISMEGVEIMGSVTFGMVDEFTYMDEGFFTFDYNSQFMPDKTHPIHKALVSGGCVLHNGKIYSNEFDDSANVQAQKPKWRIYDAQTFQLLSEKELSDNCEATTYSMAYDPTTNKIYGLLATFTETFFMEIDPESGAMKRINELNRDYKFFALACSKNGTIYCTYLVKETNELFLAKIRKTDGKVAIVNAISAANFLPGDQLINSSYDQAMFFNNADNKLYWIFGSSSLYLYKEYTALAEINTTNATTTLIGYLPDMFLISGAFLMEPALKAPAIVSDFQFIPEKEGSLQGKLQFKLPETSYDGTAMTEPLTITVKEGDKILLSETGNPGTLFTSKKLEFTNELHKISITVSNKAGDSPTIERNFFVGYDIPGACQNIKLTYEGLSTTLTWDPPVEGLNGAPINKDNLTYKVVRYPYEVTVQENTQERSFTEEHPADMTRYVYMVYPVDGTRVGKGAFSNNLIVGTPLDVPYGGIFMDAADMINYYTIIDNNNDRSSWSYDIETSAAFYTFNATNDGDDWLISPPINYKKNTKYTLYFKSYSWSPDYLEAMEVKFGDARTPEAQSTLLLSLPEIPAASEDTPVQEYSVDFTVKEDGIYYYSFHAISPAMSGYLFVFDIRVTEKNQSSIESVEGLNIQVFGGKGNIRIQNPDGEEVNIYTLRGERVLTSTSLQIEQTLPSGIYLVKSKNQLYKTIIF